MIFTPRILVLVTFMVFLAVLLQLSFFSLTPVFGSVANVVPVLIVALGLLAGAVPGALAGFGAGLLLDATLGGTLGVTSLALLSAGYLAGRWRESYDIVSSLVPPLLSGALTAVYAIVLAALSVMLGIDAAVSILFVREIAVQALLAMLLAVPLFPLVRRVLRPALVDDRLDSRRRSGRGMLGVAG